MAEEWLSCSKKKALLEAVKKGYTTSETEDTVWCLLYNLTKVSELKEASVREAFTKAIDRSALEKEFYEGISPAAIPKLSALIFPSSTRAAFLMER